MIQIVEIFGWYKVRREWLMALDLSLHVLVYHHIMQDIIDVNLIFKYCAIEKWLTRTICSHACLFSFELLLVRDHSRVLLAKDQDSILSSGKVVVV